MALNKLQLLAVIEGHVSTQTELKRKLVNMQALESQERLARIAEKAAHSKAIQELGDQLVAATNFAAVQANELAQSKGQLGIAKLEFAKKNIEWIQACSDRHTAQISYKQSEKEKAVVESEHKVLQSNHTILVKSLADLTGVMASDARRRTAGTTQWQSRR